MRETTTYGFDIGSSNRKSELEKTPI